MFQRGHHPATFNTTLNVLCRVYRRKMDSEQPATPLTRPKPRFLASTGRHGTYKKLPPTTPMDRGRWVYVQDDKDDRDDDLGYASSAFRALPHEPECVGPAILGDYAEVAALHRSQQHALDVAEAQQRRPELTPQNRLNDVHRRAKHAHVDLSHPIHLVQRAIDKARLREQPVSPAALERLSGLEALLDGVDLRAA